MVSQEKSFAKCRDTASWKYSPLSYVEVTGQFRKMEWPQEPVLQFGKYFNQVANGKVTDFERTFDFVTYWINSVFTFPGKIAISL